MATFPYGYGQYVLGNGDISVQEAYDITVGSIDGCVRVRERARAKLGVFLRTFLVYMPPTLVC